MRKGRLSFVIRGCALAGALGSLVGCLAPPGLMGPGIGNVKPGMKVRGPGADGTEDVTVLELQMRLFDLADLWASLVKSVCDPVVADAKSQSTRSAVIQMKLRATTSGYAIGASPDPVGGILDMMVLSRLFHMATQEGTRQYQDLGGAAPMVAAGMAEADETIWKSAGSMLTKEQQAKLEAKIDQWYRANPNITFVSFARLNDIDSVFDANLEREVNQSQGLMQVLDAALQSAEEYRLLGERSLWLAARAPVLIRMSTEATLQTVVDEPMVGDALVSFDQMPKVVSRLITSIDGLPTMLNEQRAEIVQAIDSASRSLEPLVRESHAVVDRTSEVLKEARALAAEPNASVVAAASAAKDLREAAQTIDALALRFAPEAGKGGKDSGQTVADLARAAEQLNAAMTTLSALTSSSKESPIAEISKLADLKVAMAERAGQDLINYAFWRLVILLVGAFGLLVAYRALTGRSVKG